MSSDKRVKRRIKKLKDCQKRDLQDTDSKTNRKTHITDNLNLTLEWIVSFKDDISECKKYITEEKKHCELALSKIYIQKSKLLNAEEKLSNFSKKIDYFVSNSGDLRQSIFSRFFGKDGEERKDIAETGMEEEEKGEDPDKKEAVNLKPGGLLSLFQNGQDRPTKRNYSVSQHGNMPLKGPDINAMPSSSNRNLESEEKSNNIILQKIIELLIKADICGSNKNTADNFLRPNENDNWGNQSNNERKNFSSKPGRKSRDDSYYTTGILNPKILKRNSDGNLVSKKTGFIIPYIAPK